MLIDTHCHLDAAEFDIDRAAVAEAAARGGVGEVWVPAVEHANFAAVHACCKAYPGCRPAYGIHPMYVMRAKESDLEGLSTWLASAEPIAVGEIGLDFYVPGLDHDRQKHFFCAQLKLARRFELPVLLHVRRAIDAVLKELRRLPVRGGVAHAFNGSRQQADEFIKLGFKLGFGGAFTYAGSTRIRALAQSLPLESIVLETDAPDIPPAWLQRGRNSPAELPRIATELARLRGLPLETIVEVTGNNAREILRA